MPLSTTPQRHRTSSLKLSHTKTTPVLLSPFSDCKTPNSPAHPVSKSCSCNTTRKRRRLPTVSRSSRRPRRQDCPLGLNPHGSSVFDHLPWVSILDAPAPQVNSWDVADLSQLPIDGRSLPLGPIRRRKTSFALYRSLLHLLHPRHTRLPPSLQRNMLLGTHGRHRGRSNPLLKFVSKVCSLSPSNH